MPKFWSQRFGGIGIVNPGLHEDFGSVPLLRIIANANVDLGLAKAIALAVSILWLANVLVIQGSIPVVGPTNSLYKNLRFSFLEK